MFAAREAGQPMFDVEDQGYRPDELVWLGHLREVRIRPMGAATSPAPPAARRATLDDLGLTTGEKARLRVLLHRIFGRNLWQRPMADALAITERIKETVADYGTPDGR